MFSLILSLLGIVGGIALAFIAPEELQDGHRYFIWLKRSLLLIIIGISAFYLRQQQVMLMMIMVIGIIVVILNLSISWKALEIINYVFFGIIYFSDKNMESLLAAAVFLYGLPLGSLLEEKYHFRKIFKK